MYFDRFRGGVPQWRCSERKRQYERDRYDADPVRRIEKNLKNDALKRRQTIERRRANGQVSHEGRR